MGQGLTNDINVFGLAEEIIKRHRKKRKEQKKTKR